MSQELFNIKKFQTRNDLLAADNRPASHLQELKNATFTELGAITSINGNQIMADSQSIYSEAPDGDVGDSCYWNAAGTLVADSLYLFGTHIGIKFPMTEFTGLTADEMTINLTLGATETTSFSGAIYLATSAWDKTTAAHPTYETSSSIPVFLTNPGETKAITLPNSWLTSLLATNYGFVIVTDSGVISGIESFSITYGFGTGVDDDIVVSADTTIEDLYVSRGHSAGTYDPKNGICINANNFTILSGVTLNCVALGSGTDTKKGAIVIKCQGFFKNYGNIVGTGLGYTAAGTGPGHGNNGYELTIAGSGGSGAGYSSVGSGSADGVIPGGNSYGTSALSDAPSSWINLYGSAGGYGGTWGGGGAGAAGAGGAIIRIQASSIDNYGTIKSNGTDGGYGFDARSGGGGAGSGGSIYLEARDYVNIGFGLVEALGANGGAGANNGGASSAGRIRIVGELIGSTNPTHTII